MPWINKYSLRDWTLETVVKRTAGSRAPSHLPIQFVPPSLRLRLRSLRRSQMCSSSSFSRILSVLSHPFHFSREKDSHMSSINWIWLVVSAESASLQQPRSLRATTTPILTPSPLNHTIIIIAPVFFFRKKEKERRRSAVLFWKTRNGPLVARRIARITE